MAADGHCLEPFEQQSTADKTPAGMCPKKRALLISVRQALIMVLGALEDYLDLDRSILPRHKRAGASAHNDF